MSGLPAAPGRLPRPGRLPGPGRLPRPGRLPAAVLRAAPARRVTARPRRRLPGPGLPPGARRLRPAQGGQPGYGARPRVTTTTAVPCRAGPTRGYGRPVPGVSRPGRLSGPGRLPRPGRYPDQGGYGGQAYGRQDQGYGAQPDYGRYGEPGVPDTPSPGYGEPAGGGYDYGQPAAGGYGYGQGDYPAAGATSRCSSTTAAAAPTSCARAPT